MGMNATVVVLLDTMDEMTKDPEFGRHLVQAILWRANNGPGEAQHKHHPEPYHRSQFQVVEVHHADNQAIVAVGANCGRQIGWSFGWTKSEDEIIEELYKDLKRRRREEKKAKEKANG
jgi:hypothetical protein